MKTKTVWQNKKYGRREFFAKYVRVGDKRLLYFFNAKTGEPIDWYESHEDAKHPSEGWVKA